MEILQNDIKYVFQVLPIYFSLFLNRSHTMQQHQSSMTSTIKYMLRTLVTVNAFHINVSSPYLTKFKPHGNAGPDLSISPDTQNVMCSAGLLQTGYSNTKHILLKGKRNLQKQFTGQLEDILSLLIKTLRPNISRTCFIHQTFHKIYDIQPQFLI